jgi:hypothetical protein
MPEKPENAKQEFAIEELPQPEETLSPEEAEAAEGGIIIVGGRYDTIRYTCAGSGDPKGSILSREILPGS